MALYKLVKGLHYHKDENGVRRALKPGAKIEAGDDFIGPTGAGRNKFVAVEGGSMESAAAKEDEEEEDSEDDEADEEVEAPRKKKVKVHETPRKKKKASKKGGD